MKAIRIKFFQGTASFKEPLWNGTLLPTRPLPPYSTVIGMIHTLCQWEELHRIKLSLTCTNEHLGSPQSTFNKGYIGGVTFGTINDEAKARWSTIVEGAFDDYIGFTSRLYITELLVDRCYTLHICVEDENEFNQIFKAFNYPPVYPSLGRWEDSIRIDDVKIVEVKEELTHGKLNCYTWLPVKDNSVERIGSVWKIPTYYKIVRDKRRFEYIKCYLGERGALALYRLDENNEQLILI